MKPTPARRTVFLAISLLLTVLILASDVEAGKKKKKKKDNKKQPAEVAETQEKTVSGLAARSSAIREANRHLVAYDTEAARRALDAAAPENDAWTVTARGRVLELDRKYEAAATELRRAADIDTRNPAPVLFLGDTYSYANKRGSADDAYAQAEARARGLLETKSDDPDALYFLGVAQQRQKRFSEAAGTLEQARSLSPNDAMILYQLGATRFYQDQFQPAFDMLTAALERNSGIAYAYYYRGLAASKLKRTDILYNDLDRFVKMAPNAPEAETARQILASFG